MRFDLTQRKGHFASERRRAAVPHRRVFFSAARSVARTDRGALPGRWVSDPNVNKLCLPLLSWTRTPGGGVTSDPTPNTYLPTFPPPQRIRWACVCSVSFVCQQCSQPCKLDASLGSELDSQSANQLSTAIGQPPSLQVRARANPVAYAWLWPILLATPPTPCPLGSQRRPPHGCHRYALTLVSPRTITITAL